MENKKSEIFNLQNYENDDDLEFYMKQNQNDI